MPLTRHQQAYRQWIDTYVVTRNPRHLKTALACQRVATEEIGATVAAMMLRRIELAAARKRRLITKPNAQERTEP
jgi:hypothetical protein